MDHFIPVEVKIISADGTYRLNMGVGNKKLVVNWLTVFLSKFANL